MKTLIFLLGLTTGCTTEETKANSDTGGQNGHSNPTTQDDSYNMEERTWMVTERVFTFDPCGIEGFIPQGGSGTLLDFVPASAQGFTIERNGNPDHCSLDGNEFQCELRTDRDNTPQEFDMDATILVDVEIKGAFSGEDRTQMTVHYGLDCEGPDCEMLTDLLGGQMQCDLETESVLEPYVR